MPEIVTTRLLLRPFAINEGPTVERIAGAREVADTTLTIPHPYPEGAGAQWIATHADAWERGERLTLAVCRQTTSDVVGAIGLHIAAAHAHGEIGYWIGQADWGKGYATEAARAITGYAFDVVRLHRVLGRHFTRNVASGRVMEKLGMRREGVHRDAFQRWGRFEDVAVWAMLEDEWRAAAPSGVPILKA